MTTLRSLLHHRTRLPRSLLALAVVASMTAVSATPAVAAADESNPVAQDEQAMLYQLNGARWDPAGFAEASGIGLDGVLPRPPMADNAELTGSAEFKADEIAQNGYFAHQSSVTGVWPNELARSWSYRLPDPFPDDANNIESLHSGSPVPFNVLGSFAGSPTHRDHVFGQGWFATHLEVGVGRSATENVWVVHTGYQDDVGVFLTGTVFDDLNGNGSMDAGEGLPGITITAGGLTTTTNGGGGYSIEVPPGKHTITASGPGFEGTSSAVIRVTEYNVGADFISGVAKPVVRDYLLCKGREPTILGTSGNDIIYGTDGPDVIHGLAGRDKIYGLGGNDFLCGGGGNDLLYGGGGQDRLLGGWGNDLIYGNSGYDRLYGGMGTDTLNGGKRIDKLNGGKGIDTCLTGETLSRCP